MNQIEKAELVRQADSYSFNVGETPSQDMKIAEAYIDGAEYQDPISKNEMKKKIIDLIEERMNKLDITLDSQLARYNELDYLWDDIENLT